MMNTLNNKKHCIWVRQAKTGSTSVEHLLNDHGLFCPLSQFSRYRSQKHILAVDELDKLKSVGIDIKDCWTWTVFRDPVDRFVSAYRGHTWAQDKTIDQLLDEPLSRDEGPTTDPNWKNIQCFRNSRQCDCRRCRESAWRHIYRSATCACSYDGKLAIDHVMTFSLMWSEIDVMLTNLNIPHSMNEYHDNTSSRSRPNITSEQIDKIKALFADDYSNFSQYI